MYIYSNRSRQLKCKSQLLLRLTCAWAESIPNAGPFSELPCNAFAFCPDEVCFEPDAHHHTKGDCWLKFTEGPVSPEVGQRIGRWR
jgi:hypothetical protein